MKRRPRRSPPRSSRPSIARLTPAPFLALRYLEEAQTQYRGHDGGAREILLAKQTDPPILPGLKGTFVDCLTVSRELRPAIEAALGPGLSALIVETVEDARAALQRLGAEAKGQVTFVPIASLRLGPALTWQWMHDWLQR